MLAYTKFEVLRTMHNIRYLVFLVLMPVVFELIWGKQGQGVTAAMAVYAATGAGLLGSGNTIAEDRNTGWLRQLRVTPLSDKAWLTGKIVQGIITVIPGVLLVSVIGAYTQHIDRWPLLVAVTVVGSLPFVLIGVFAGMLFKGKTATVALMLVFFALMFTGGVIGGDAIWALAPTNSLMTLGMGTVMSRPIGAEALLNLGAWTIAAAVAVLLRWRRA
ncbi:ABC transporter permease [Kibdelosporangium philippinense]|uniref:ABC transporter permease n=1 Tax=Kibdelosporangium philippinense TaxID=211113 RepID=A0ABS8ZN24_9PSEU|nr:ABC transporter permease [Kibdelosporangium philippinense]MCE7008947.1 ABC transporter permease [Kibdelosporangium philippinense]